jgi:hypothetical protein
MNESTLLNHTSMPSDDQEPNGLQHTPLTPLRVSLDRHLHFYTKKYAFFALTSYDMTAYETFYEQCLQYKRRPPSTVAYVARCLGVVLARDPSLLASRYRDTMVVPSRIGAVITVEGQGPQGEKTPRLLTIDCIDTKSLQEIADELKTGSRPLKREVVELPPSKFFPRRPYAPAWWRNLRKRVLESRSATMRVRAEAATNVGISSTTQLMKGRGGWGAPVYMPTSLSLMLGGLSKRAAVVDDQVVAQLQLDVTVNFDHLLVDGAPATRFLVALGEEIESGRLLNEYSMKKK